MKVEIGKKYDDNGERTDKSFKDIYDKIPDRFYDIAGFCIVIMMICLLSFEEIYRMCSLVRKYNFYSMLYYLIGAFAEIFAVFYIGSFFYRKEKFSFRRILKNNIWDIALLAMLIWSVLSAFMADDVDFALHGTLYRKDGLYTYFVYAGMYICAKAINSSSLKMWVFRTISIVSTGLSIMTVCQYFPGITKMLGKHAGGLDTYMLYSATFNNTNHFAYFLTISIMSMAGLIIIEKKLISKIVFGCMYGFNIWALIINNTFGSYLGVAMGIILLSVLFIIKNKKNVWAVLAVVVILVGVSCYMNNNNGSISNNFSQTYSDAQKGLSYNRGGSERIGLWKQAFKFIKERPVFGYGPEGLWDKYYDAGFTSDRPHNEYIQHMVFLGIPAAVFYLTALISLCIYCIKRIKKLDIIILAAGGVVFGYCVSAFFGNTMYYSTPYFFMFLGMLSVCHLNTGSEQAFS